MAMKTVKADEQVKVRALVAALSDDEARLVAAAVSHFVGALDLVDRLNGDPEARDQMAVLARLSTLLNRANATRDFLEGNE